MASASPPFRKKQKKSPWTGWRWYRWVVLLGGLGLSAWLGCGGGGHDANPTGLPPEKAPLLFADGEQRGGTVGSECSCATVIRQRWVQVRRDLLTGPNAPPAVTLNLFPDASYIALRKRLEWSSQGSRIWVGHLQGIPESEVNLSVKDEVVIGNILFSGRFYQVRYSGGSQILYEVDPGSFPLCAGGLVPPSPFSPERRAVSRSRSRSDSGSMVDVLVVYTEAAKNGAGGQTAMEALIDLAESETNQGYVNSQVIQRIRVVHTQEVGYDETGFNWPETLERLTSPNDGYMDEVHPWRDTYAADEVVLLVNNSQYCGVGWLMSEGWVGPQFADYAFCMVSRVCATGYYSFAHEMGHNMGCQHDRDSAQGQQGAYPYSYGYRNANFRTIMAYGGSGIGPRINHWSNPNVLYKGEPTGIPEGDPLAADNAKTLNNTRFIVANFRDAPNLVPTLTGGEREPDQGDPGDTFTYRVTYTDADNEAPSFVRVHIKRYGKELAGSPYSMSVVPGGDGNFANGEEYQYLTALPQPGDYTYWFEASDGTDTVQTGEQLGPQMWAILVAEDFEGSFPAEGWWTWDQDGVQFGEYFWGLDNSHPYEGHWAVWCAAGGSGPRPFGGYPNHCQSWLVYGPFSLAQAVAAELSFFYESEIEDRGDTFFYGYSTDGQHFRGEYLNASSRGYVEARLDLRAACGKGRVWIAFLFASDAAGSARGVWIDDLILRQK